MYFLINRCYYFCMKKLLLILICLFVSFEVKSQSPPNFNEYLGFEGERHRLSQYYPNEYVQIEKCVKYFEKGKTITSWSHEIHKNRNRVDVVFVYKGETYLIIVNTRKTKKKYEQDLGLVGLSYIGCLKFDINSRKD